MAFDFFSKNYEIMPVEQANILLSDVAYSYGYGVYETIRVTAGEAKFLRDHLDRLFGSAEIIGLEHNFGKSQISETINTLISKNRVDACNLKVLLIGGRASADANLYVICLNPLFPDRKLYKKGVHCTTYEYERLFPHAKTLNMLPSYLAYRDAQKAEAYDALLIDRAGNIIEGTRTNFFAIQDRTIYSPPEDRILLGVTRAKMLEAAQKAGFSLEYRDLQFSQIAQYDNVFLTSTSSKVMPIKSINQTEWQLKNPLLELTSLL